MKVERDGVEHYGMYIDGEWVDTSSGKVEIVENPANENIIGAVPSGTAEDGVRALEAATRAQKAWAATPAADRGNYLFALAEKLIEHQERLAELLVHENGKPIALAMGEVFASADFLRFAGQAGRRLEGDIFPSDRPQEQIWIQKVPYGVTVGLAGYNFPLALALRKVGPSLVAGNTMVIKPPTVSPLAVLEMAQLAHEAGMPKGVLNVVTGPGGTIGQELVTNPLTKLFTMTGSSATGRKLFAQAAEHLTAVRLELGGKAPFILLKDGDVDRAAEVAVSARFLHGGQVCTCNERMYIDESVYDEFMEKFMAGVAKVTVGDPMTDVDYGPKVSAVELEKVESMVAQAVKDGCEVLSGGKRPQGGMFDKGHWYEPTVLANARNDMEIVQEEIFGPVVPVMKISGFDEALAMANDCQYGLSAYVFTQDMRKVMRLIQDLEFGEIYVNRPMGEQRQGFHNGWKMSGTGGEDGKYGLENYLQKKTFYVDFS
jgi:lactaldehyde dehydrogenase/glycolaldehyde dehydrogenase